MISEKSERLFASKQEVAARRRTAETRESYDERLNRILEAATTVIARVGYERASMRSVARAAGVSSAGMYHYFNSKERMLFLIQFRTFNALLGNLKEKLHGVENPIEQLRMAVRAHVGYFGAHMAALKVCSHELDSLSGAAYEETRRIRREYYDIIRSIVDRILNVHTHNTAIDRHVATMSLFGMLNWLYHWYDPKAGRSLNALASQIAEQFLHGILAGNGPDESRT